MIRVKKRRRLVAIVVLAVVLAFGSQIVFAFLTPSWSFGTRMIGAVLLGLVIGVALGFATGKWMAREHRREFRREYSLDDDEIGPDHPLYPILMGTMEKGAVYFEAADTPDGIDIRNVRYEDDEPST